MTDKPEQVDAEVMDGNEKQTGREVTVAEPRAPATTDTLTMMPVEQVAEAVEYVQQIKQRVLKEKSDYGVIPNTTKPTLLKPGMEKLCLAFSLSVNYRIDDKIEDPHLKWVYLAWDKKEKKEVERQTIGWYSYTVECTLRHKNSGIVAAQVLGTCTSSDRGKEKQPSNAILKMAEKRALGLAVQNATGSSHLFDVDLDDMDPSEYGRGSTSAPPSKGDGTDIWQWGKHKDQEMSKLPRPYLEWAADKDGPMAAAAKAELDRRDADQTPESDRETNSKDKSVILNECMQLEVKCTEAELMKASQAPDLREKYAGKISLSDCVLDGDKSLRSYHKALSMMADSIGKQVDQTDAFPEEEK